MKKTAIKIIIIIAVFSIFNLEKVHADTSTTTPLISIYPENLTSYEPNFKVEYKLGNDFVGQSPPTNQIQIYRDVGSGAALCADFYLTQFGLSMNSPIYINKKFFETFGITNTCFEYGSGESSKIVDYIWYDLSLGIAPQGHYEAPRNDLEFGMAILIVFASLSFIGFFFNSILTKKRRW